MSTMRDLADICPNGGIELCTLGRFAELQSLRYNSGMNIYGFDHIVLCVRSVEATLEFYQRVLGLEAREERAGKWSLHFGSNKISVQDASALPSLAETTVPGSGNFCVLTDLPIEDVITQLRSNDVEIVEGPAEKAGAVGKLMSVYFRDPDANLVEVSSRIS